jgi:hypothetical protein
MFPFNSKQGLGDPLHPSPFYSELIGCAAAQLIIATAQRGSSSSSSSSAKVTTAVPLALLSSSGRSASLPTPQEAVQEPWCLRAGDTEMATSMVENSGWAIRSGGAGGSKRWLHARGIGSSLTLTLRMTSRRLAIEYYKHDTMPLALVHANTTWHPRDSPRRRQYGLPSSSSPSSSPPVPQPEPGVRSTSVLLDGHCAKPHACVQGQGFYYRALLADNIEGASVATPLTASLRLTVVPRRDGRNGSEFSVATVVAEV